MSKPWFQQNGNTTSAGGISGWLDTFSCNCIGPQNGQPRCPCAMRNVVQRDGRWIEPEKDLGPVSPTPTATKD